MTKKESDMRGGWWEREEQVHEELFKLKFCCKINWNPGVGGDDHLYADGSLKGDGKK